MIEIDSRNLFFMTKPSFEVLNSETISKYNVSGNSIINYGQIFGHLSARAQKFFFYFDTSEKFLRFLIT